MTDDLTLAESSPIGTLLEWPAAPRVEAPVGDLAFAAPSAVGQVVGATYVDGKPCAAVRFRYRNPTGGQSWSAPIVVLPGQPCRVVGT